MGWEEGGFGGGEIMTIDTFYMYTLFLIIMRL